MVCQTMIAALGAVFLLAGCGDRGAGMPDPGSPVESAVPPKRFSAVRGAAQQPAQPVNVQSGYVDPGL